MGKMNPVKVAQKQLATGYTYSEGAVYLMKYSMTRGERL